MLMVLMMLMMLVCTHDSGLEGKGEGKGGTWVGLVGLVFAITGVGGGVCGGACDQPRKKKKKHRLRYCLGWIGVLVVPPLPPPLSFLFLLFLFLFLP